MKLGRGLGVERVKVGWLDRDSYGEAIQDFFVQAEDGIRDTHRPGHRVDHSRLSHMASVALSSEAREQQQREQQLLRNH